MVYFEPAYLGRFEVEVQLRRYVRQGRNGDEVEGDTGAEEGSCLPGVVSMLDPVDRHG